MPRRNTESGRSLPTHTPGALGRADVVANSEGSLMWCAVSNEAGSGTVRAAIDLLRRWKGVAAVHDAMLRWCNLSPLWRSHGGAGPATLALITLALALGGGRAAADNGLIELDSSGRVAHVFLTVGKSQTLRMSGPVADVLVANTDIADLQPLTDQMVYVIGKKIGVTRLTMFDGDKTFLGIVELEVGFDVEGLREELSSSVPAGEFRLPAFYAANS